MNNINLKNIIIESVSENKSIFAGLGSIFTGLIIAQVIFPRQYSNFVAEIPDSINGLDYKVMAFILIPYLAAELLYYVADLIDSKVMPEIELSVIKKLSDKVFESTKTTKKEVNANELILNLKKIFDVRYGYHLITSYMLPALIVSAGIGFYFLYADRKLGIVTLVILTMTFIALVIMGNKCFVRTNNNEKNINLFCDDVHDIFNNVDHVLVAGMEKNESKRIDNNKSELYLDCVKKERCNTHLKFIFSIAYFFIMITLNGMALSLFFNGKINKSTLVTIFFMVLALVQLYDEMLYELHNIIGAVGSYQELESYFKNFEIKDRTLIKKMIVDQGNVKFENIGLKYGTKVIFNNFNLQINGNSRTAIMGEIGSGKTTLFKMLVDLIKYEGNIYLDNKNTKQYDYTAIIKNVAYIPQNPKLFNRTILENLKYGSDNNVDQVKNILSHFDMLTFFDKFEKGLYTNVGKNGEKLSGGQRQFVYILRSLIQNKKILLFDEPSSALDESYKKILMNILQKINDKTIIVITHDNDLLSIFDRIIVLNNGKIIEDIHN